MVVVAPQQCPTACGAMRCTWHTPGGCDCKETRCCAKAEGCCTGAAAARIAEVQQASRKAGVDAASAAAKAGGTPAEVDATRTQAINTVRLNGEEAVRDAVDKEERDIVIAASQTSIKEKKNEEKMEAENKATAKVDKESTRIGSDVTSMTFTKYR